MSSDWSLAAVLITLILCLTTCTVMRDRAPDCPPAKEARQ